MTTIHDMALTDWTETQRVFTGMRARGIVPQDTTWEWLAPILYQDWMQHLTDRATRDTIWEHIVKPRDEDV